jgi:hypothetical protein
MTTIALEELAPETRQVLEEWISSEAPVTFLREGQMCAELTPYAVFDLTPEEEEELTEIFREGDEDFAAGRYITLDEFKIKYADKLSGKTK